MKHTPPSANQVFADYIAHSLKALDTTKSVVVSAYDVRELDSERRELVTEALGDLLDAQHKLQAVQRLSLPVRHFGAE